MWLNFTFKYRYAAALLAEIDGRAWIEDGEIDYVQLSDLNTRNGFTLIGGDLEKLVKLQVYSDHAADILRMYEDQRAGRKVYDREMAKAAD